MESNQNAPAQTLFRQKAIERISSPEELDRYLKVTGPGVWLPLIAVIVLLIGCLGWMILGQVNVTVPVAVVVKDGSAVCYVPADVKDDALATAEVTVSDKTYKLSDVGLAELVVGDSMDANIIRIGRLEGGSLVSPLSVEASMADGLYAGEIAVQAIHPIKFIIN